MSAALEQVLKRDRIVVGVALAAITTVAWLYLLRLNSAMSSSAVMLSMPGMPAMGPAQNPFTPINLMLVIAMWATMMVGMMIPSASPMILLYARVARRAHAEGKPFAATGWFAGGYVLAWTAFAIIASVAQSELSSVALITPMMSTASDSLAGAILITAGLYQWTPLKSRCLVQCQAPLGFLQRHGGFRRDVRGSLALGLTHGVYCIGCCWALMALLFVGGVMNVLWVAALSIFVLLEKLIPVGAWVSRSTGLILIVAGAVLVIRHL